jgi:hypothetical protein
MRRRLLLLGVAAAGVGAAVLRAFLLARDADGGRLITPGTTDLAPWAQGPAPARNVPAIPVGGRFCRRDDLWLRIGDGVGINSLTTEYWLAARNVGARTCVLRGIPAVRVVRQGNGPLTIREAASSTLADYPPAAPAFGLARGKESTSLLLAYDECIYPTTRRSQALVRLGIAGHASTRLRLTTCASGVTLEVGAWQPPPLPEHEQREAWPFEARLSLPASAVAGRPVSYRVSLRNRGSRPFRFPWCPSFWAGIDGGDGAGSGVLNCVPAGSMAAGESVTFPLRLRVSRHFRPGRHVVSWGLLGLDGETRVVARASLRLTRG